LLSASYSFTLLPPLPGGSAAQALVINSSGVAAGYSTVNGLPEATEWMNGTPIDLGPGYVLAINDSGALAGIVVGPDNHNEAAHWESGSRVPMTIGAPAGFDSMVANGIDANGTITGIAFNSFDVSQEEAWEWTPDGTLVLVPQLLESFATHSGEMVGIAPNFNAATTQAFLWRQGVLTLLGTGNTTFSTALGINSSGVVVGYVEQPQGNMRARNKGIQRILNPPVGGMYSPWAGLKRLGLCSSRVACLLPAVGYSTMPLRSMTTVRL
jgi:uncharacterized membrane protein